MCHSVMSARQLATSRGSMFVSCRSLARQQTGSPSGLFSRWVDQQDLPGPRPPLQQHRVPWCRQVRGGGGGGKAHRSSANTPQQDCNTVTPLLAFSACKCWVYAVRVGLTVNTCMAVLLQESCKAWPHFVAQLPSSVYRWANGAERCLLSNFQQQAALPVPLLPFASMSGSRGQGALHCCSG